MNMIRVNITLPQEEHDEAMTKIPRGEVRTFSALVREALKKIPSPRKK